MAKAQVVWSVFFTCSRDVKVKILEQHTFRLGKARELQFGMYVGYM